jgi:LDH2 family malate/lactate/ureidoglycolate dehydrogenase
MALAFPTNSDPVVADFSTAAVSMGKVGLLTRQGRKAHDKVFMDNQGNLSDDPRVVRPGNDEPFGSILFAGQMATGHKVYALSLWCEAMTAMVGGNCNNPDMPQRQTFTLTVIDGAAFAGMDAYRKEMSRFVEWAKTSRVLPGYDGIRLPGGRGVALLRKARAEGVPVDDARLENLNELAATCGVAKLS